MTSAVLEAQAVEDVYDFAARSRTEAFDRSQFLPVDIGAAAFTDPGLPRWFGSLLPVMCDLARLRDNWDGRNSAAVRHDVLRFVASVLSRVMSPRIPAPSLVPLGNGGIQMIWGAVETEIEAEISRPNSVVLYLLDRQTTTESELELGPDFSALAAVLRAAFV